MNQKYLKVVQAWNNKKIQSKEDLDTVLSNYKILFAYHSNKIEEAGVSIHQTREIFENGKVLNYTGELRALFETQNQKTCYEWLRESIVSKEKITPEFICKMHEILNHGCYDEARWSQDERPGEYKKHFYGVGMDAGVAPEDVAEEIAFICNQVAGVPIFVEEEHNDENTKHITDILTAAAYLHHNFENIHPFADGNGRCGRALLNYFLMIHQLPPTIIFEEDKELYYQSLLIFDKTEKLDGFVEFLQDETVKTWYKEPMRRAGGRIPLICL